VFSSFCGVLLINLQLRRHIFNDLQPYVCTQVICEAASQTFKSWSSWVQHESSHLVLEASYRLFPFCPETKGPILTKTYFKHLSRHLPEIALAVLPQTHDSDLDSDTQSNFGSDGAAVSQASIPEELIDPPFPEILAENQATPNEETPPIDEPPQKTDPASVGAPSIPKPATT
jgi:hypothetical protein